MSDCIVTVNEACHDKPLRYKKFDWSTLYDDTVTVGKDYFNKIKEQTTWISVKDRLPEMGVGVLVYTECKNTFIAEIVDMSINVKNIVWSDCYGYYLEENVTHWRPLPEPPESEDTE